MLKLTEEQKKANNEWLEALRSGAYEQGKDFLKNGDKHCCLGVDCVLAGVPQVKNSLEEPVFNFGNLWESNRDPEHQWFEIRHGFEVNDLRILNKGRSVRVWEANDSGSTFAEIADGIEAWLKNETDQYA